MGADMRRATFYTLAMGLTSVTGIVKGPTGVTRAVDFLVDSGAKYSVLPEAVWRALGLEPKRRMTFVLADGSRIERDISECHIELPQGDGHTPVILGQGGDEPLLGVVTLEMLGFILYPFDRTIRPAQMMSA
jgi:clan AA aspartic protease